MAAERKKVKFIKDFACGRIQYKKDEVAMLTISDAKRAIKGKFASEEKGAENVSST